MVAGRTGWEAASGGAESLDDAGGSTLALTAFSVGSEGGRGAAASDMARGGGGKGERQAWEELTQSGGRPTAGHAQLALETVQCDARWGG